MKFAEWQAISTMLTLDGRRATVLHLTEEDALELTNDVLDTTHLRTQLSAPLKTYEEVKVLGATISYVADYCGDMVPIKVSSATFVESTADPVALSTGEL